MLFTATEIQRILSNIDFTIAKLVAETLGKEYLTRDDIDLLKKRGVDLVKLIPKFPSHFQAFLFGRVSAAIGTKGSSRMTYSEFTKFLANMGAFAPKTPEMEFYKVAANKTYTHIKGLGERFKNDVRASVASEELNFLAAKKASETRKVIHDEILDGTFERRAVKKITSNIAHQMNDWRRDWGRIVETECQDVYNLGRAQFILSENPESKVYFDVYPGACRHCIRLYLTGGIGSKPRVFNLQELLANGTNYGVKAKDWKPTIHPVHPFCFNSPATKIFTINGWKNISEIKCGDLVLTHKNRFRRVLETYKRKVSGNEEIYNVEFEVLTRYGQRTTKVLNKITGNHPVLLNGEWKEIQFANVGDKLEIKGVECESCGKLIQVLPIRNNNLDICGFSETEIREHGEKVFEKLKLLFKNHSGKFHGIEAKITKIEKVNIFSKYLFNFAVEEDESYIADGVVVHNCRCDLRELPPGYEWDEETHQFAPRKDYERQVERKGKVRITIGDREYTV